MVRAGTLRWLELRHDRDVSLEFDLCSPVSVTSDFTSMIKHMHRFAPFILSISLEHMHLLPVSIILPQDVSHRRVKPFHLRKLPVVRI